MMTLRLETRTWRSPAAAKPIAEAPRIRVQEQRKERPNAKIKRPPGRPFRQRRVVVKLPPKRRAPLVVVPMPQKGSRIDHTPRRYDGWGYLRSGTMDRRLRVERRKDVAAPPAKNAVGGAAALAFLAALLFA